MSRAASSGTVLALRRVGAMVLRHYFLLKGSWPRALELVYWPTMQVVLWGLITQFFLTHSAWLVQASGVLIAAVLLWDVVFRGQISVALSFLEEMWSRNLGNLFVSPLHPVEFVAALFTVSLVRTLIGMLPAAGVAILLFHYSIFSMGLPLIVFFANLIVFGWSTGMACSALILRYGLGAESIAWVAVFAFAPLSGIYYPVATLPAAVQPIAWALPPAYVFEGMRAVLFEGIFRFDLLAAALMLNAVYLCLAVATFLYAFHIARVRGLLLQGGE
ncbi:MAG: ABC transporter permease [Alphaproteobacteria bacterium]|nr:ABC transporter permease [Alphaproteobacteria bacterium]